jgi:hypothetical protein
MHDGYAGPVLVSPFNLNLRIVILLLVTQAIQTTRQNLDSITMAVRGKMVEIQARRQGAMAMRQQQQQQGAAAPAAS